MTKQLNNNKKLENCSKQMKQHSLGHENQKEQDLFS